MKILFIVSLALATTGCAELHHKALGTRVHRFQVGGTEYVHCSILMDPRNAQLSHDSIEVCRDELQAPARPEPLKAK